MGSQSDIAILSVSSLQDNVQTVTQIMRTNVQKVLIRESHLEELDKRASMLSESASHFQLQVKELRHSAADHFKNNVRGALLLAAPVLLFFAILYCLVMIGALAIKNRRQQQLLKSKSVTSNAEPNAGRDSRPEPVPEPPKPRHCSLIYIISGCLFITGFVLIIPGMVHMKSSLFITSAVLMVGGLGIAFLACGLSDYWYGSISGEHVEGGRAALNEMRKRMNMPPLPSSKKEFAKRSSDKAQANRQSKNGRQEQPLEQQRRAAAAAGDTAPVAAVTKTGDQEAASGNNNNITSELSPRSMTPDLIRSSSPKGDRECHIVTGIEKAASGLAVSAAARGVEGGGGFSSKQSSVSISEVNATTVSSSSSPPPRSSSLASAVSVTNLHQDLEASIAAHSDLPLVST